MDGLFDGFALQWRDDSGGGPLAIGLRPVQGSSDLIRRHIWRDGSYTERRIDGSTGVDSLLAVHVRHHPRVAA